MTVNDLRCEDLAKSYGTRAVLTDVDLVVPGGTLTAILGASGSGKTTLLRIIIGFITADRGTVTVGDRVVADAGRVHLAPDKRAVGYVAQEGALFPHVTVAENVAFGLPRSERRSTSRIGEALELVGLDQQYAARRPSELSGGEQRRVALARALAPRPRLVLLDEPFSGLDAALRSETRDAVLNALAGEGTTAVLVTHDQGEALSMGREVAVLRVGRLVQVDTPAVLYRTPVDLDVAHFVGDAVVVPGRVRSGVVECVIGRLHTESPIEGEVDVMIRPEQIRLSRGSPTAGAAEVVGHRYYGPDTVVRLALTNGSRTPILAKTFESDLPQVGELVEIVVSGPVAVYPQRDPSSTTGETTR
jgi:iron(III) transport system ATP-binding protein